MVDRVAEIHPTQGSLESHGVFTRIPISIAVSGGSKRKRHRQPHKLEARPSMWTGRSWPLEAEPTMKVWSGGCEGE